MKWAIILLAVMMVGCTQVQTQVKDVEVGPVTTYAEQDIEQPVKEFNVRVLEQGLDPQAIYVDQGDKVVMHIINTYEEDSDGIDDNDGKWVSVEQYAQDFYFSGTTATLEFVADKTGTFAIGDESDTSPKGYLIVS